MQDHTICENVVLKWSAADYKMGVTHHFTKGSNL